MRIYDTSGRTIKTLIDNAIMNVGIHEIAWDGTNESLNQAASGVYFCQIKSSDFSNTIKLILIH
jgi:flagellar hook assembly protein FlgD